MMWIALLAAACSGASFGFIIGAVMASGKEEPPREFPRGSWGPLP